MANPVFENALSTVRQALGAVEIEIQRQSTVEVRVQGAQQRLDALRVQEAELQKANADMASRVANARQEIESAKATARQIIEDAQAQKERILADARQNASGIEARAHDAATALIDSAKRDADPYAEKVASARRELEAIKSQMDAIHAQVNSAQNTLSAMKRNAAAWGTA